jgi:pyridoxal 5'-phosphate synthase pdxT subunit
MPKGRIGVLALQGGYAAHERTLAGNGQEPVEVRYAEQLPGLDGLILPGGESSTNILLMERFGLWEPLDAFVRSGKPVLATCAGFILAAREVTNPGQKSFGWIDVTLSRNSWGRQVESFNATADDGATPMLFIRAPRVVRVGEEVEVLLTYNGEPVMVRQGNVVGATFHPELTGSREVHRRVFGNGVLR